ncbi:hypothetical protein GCM10010446_30410 [Streptomyces enissocaesilis]|uniref:Integral membrane protein n=1 Tax=Streptomyces enissocaesilis TaxID=332589 RepID=A0ABN3XAT5_9ACTN
MSISLDGDNSGAVPDRARRTRRTRRILPVRGILRGPRPDRVPFLVGTACTVVGVLDIAAGVFPRFRHSRTHTVAEVLPGALGPFAAALAISAGVLLLLLAHGLKRHKRRAWRAAVVLLPAGAAAQFAYRHSVIGVLLPMALLVLLGRHRGEFAALPDPRSRWKALANFVLLGAGSLVIGLIVVSSHPAKVVGDPSVAERLEHVLYGLFGIEGPVDYTGGISSTVGYSLGALGLLTAVTTVYLALRPQHPAARLTADEEQRLRALLARHGGPDRPGHSAPRHDRAVVFSPSGRAAVTYRVVSGVMLADGDPIGDVEAWPGAIERFLDEAGAHSWTPAVTGCSAIGGEVWARESGLDALEPGGEAAVHGPGSSLAGRAVRRMAQRIGQGGCASRARRARDLGDAGPEGTGRAPADRRGPDTARGAPVAPGPAGEPGGGPVPRPSEHLARARTGDHGRPDGLPVTTLSRR